MNSGMRYRSGSFLPEKEERRDRIRIQKGRQESLLLLALNSCCPILWRDFLPPLRMSRIEQFESNVGERFLVVVFAGQSWLSFSFSFLFVSIIIVVRHCSPSFHGSIQREHLSSSLSSFSMMRNSVSFCLQYRKTNSFLFLSSFSLHFLTIELISIDLEADSWVKLFIQECLLPQPGLATGEPDVLSPGIQKELQEQFHVYLMPNPKLDAFGECLLQVTPENIYLWDVANSKLKLVNWPLTSLRRYGSDPTKFTFEAGRWVLAWHF